MIIRDAKIEELAFIRKQRVDAYREHARHIPAGHWKGLEQAVSSEADASPGVELLVAEVEGRIAGSVALFPPHADAYAGLAGEQDYPEIRMLAVDPEFRGQGAASALIRECIRRAQAKGCRAVGLHTGEFMEQAMRLYEKLGFTRVPELDFEPADDGIVVKAFRLNLEVRQ